MVPPLEGDFVFDVCFRIAERNPSTSLHLTLVETGGDVHSVDIFFDVWSEQRATYSLEEGRVKRAGILVPLEPEKGKDRGAGFAPRVHRGAQLVRWRKDHFEARRRQNDILRER